MKLPGVRGSSLKSNPATNLMVTASEECAEISQAISKCIRFGAEGGYSSLFQKEGVNTNGEHVMKEFYQLAAVIGMLQGAGILPIMNDTWIRAVKADKRAKVKHYLTVSENLGCISTSSED